MLCDYLAVVRFFNPFFTGCSLEVSFKHGIGLLVANEEAARCAKVILCAYSCMASNVLPSYSA